MYDELMIKRNLIKGNEKYQHKELTEKIIKCVFEVHNILGSGFLEKVYENALVEELQENGLKAISQMQISVLYKGKNVGEYTSDIVVEDKIIIEIKAVEKIIDIHELQIKNYLKATGLEVGLLINFGKNVEVKRKYVKNLEVIEKQKRTL